MRSCVTWPNVSSEFSAISLGWLEACCSHVKRQKQPINSRLHVICWFWIPAFFMYSHSCGKSFLHEKTAWKISWLAFPRAPKILQWQMILIYFIGPPNPIIHVALRLRWMRAVHQFPFPGCLCNVGYVRADSLPAGGPFCLKSAVAPQRAPAPNADLTGSTHITESHPRNRDDVRRLQRMGV